MRSVFISLVCVFSLVIASCGEASGIAGTWVPDMDAMKADLDKYLKPKNMPDGPEGDVMIRKMEEAKARMADLDGLTVEVKGDGTFIHSAGGKVKEKGAWKLEGSKLIVSPTVIFGPPRIGTYERGKITFKPDGTPHSISMTLVLKKK